MLILASASPRRRDLLAAAGITCVVDAAHIDETPREDEPPAVYAERLAREKARAVAIRHPDRSVLGADTVVVVDDEILGKPVDAADALLVGRVHIAGQGATLVQVTPESVFDISGLAATCSELLELNDPAALLRSHRGERLAGTADVLANSAFDARSDALPWFLAPCDLQAIKAAGVTFVSSMLERVIEEQARGDASRAEAVRAAVVAVIGDNLGAVVPGSPEAAQLKDVLIAQGMWSQYLEVGIGPDAEIFTK